MFRRSLAWAALVCLLLLPLAFAVDQDPAPVPPATDVQPVDVEYVIHLLSDPESGDVQCYLVGPVDAPELVMCLQLVSGGSPPETPPPPLLPTP